MNALVRSLKWWLAFDPAAQARAMDRFKAPGDSRPTADLLADFLKSP